MHFKHRQPWKAPVSCIPAEVRQAQRHRRAAETVVTLNSRQKPLPTIGLPTIGNNQMRGFRREIVFGTPLHPKVMRVSELTYFLPSAGDVCDIHAHLDRYICYPARQTWIRCRSRLGRLRVGVCFMWGQETCVLRVTVGAIPSDPFCVRTSLNR